MFFPGKSNWKEWWIWPILQLWLWERLWWGLLSPQGPPWRLPQGQNQKAQLHFVQTSVLGPISLEQGWRKSLHAQNWAPHPLASANSWPSCWGSYALSFMPPRRVWGPSRHCWDVRGHWSADWSCAYSDVCGKHLCPALSLGLSIQHVHHDGKWPAHLQHPSPGLWPCLKVYFKDTCAVRALSLGSLESWGIMCLDEPVTSKQWALLAYVSACCL